MKRWFTIWVFLSLPAGILFAQTCCTGGAPLTGVLNLRAVTPGSIGVSLTYDDNKIEDYVLNNEPIAENTIQRYTRAVLSQVDYGISKNLTGTILIPYMVMGQVTQAFNGPVEGKSTGIGDILLMSQWGKLLPNQASLVLGGGLKLPVGATQNTSEAGLILPASLQPGTGSTDFLATARYQTSFTFRRSLTFAQTVNMRINTTSRSFTFHDTFRFGHVIQTFSSFADQFVILKLLHTPSLTFRYRYSGSDIIEGFANANSGGHWISIAPGWAMNITKNLLAGFTGEWPIYRDINGLQITTTRRLNFTLQYLISKKGANEL